MHRLQFAYVAPVIVLIAPPVIIRTIAAIFFFHYVLLLVSYMSRRIASPFMGIFKAHLEMIEKSRDKTWAWSCVTNDLLPTAVLFFYPGRVEVVWIAVVMIFTGYQGLLSVLYADLHDGNVPLNERGEHLQHEGCPERNEHLELIRAVRELAAASTKGPEAPQSIYLSIFGPRNQG